MYIQFSFAPFINWVIDVDTKANAYSSLWQSYMTMKIINPKLYVCYNKDPTCNANTINYCIHHPIDFTDFNIVQLTKDAIQDNTTFNYNFSINSSIGSYVKFLLYRAYFIEPWYRRTVPFNKPSDRLRWQINVFVYTPDYLYPCRYETWEYMKYI